MKEYIVEFRVRVTAVDANDAVEQAEEQLAVGNYQVEVEAEDEA